MRQYSEESMKFYKEQVIEMRKRYYNLNDDQRRYLIEVMSEIQGMISANMLEDAIELAQSIKDTISDQFGIPPAVFLDSDTHIEDLRHI